MRPGLDQRTATANVLSWSIVWKDAYLSFCSPLRSAPIALVEAIMKAKPHPEQGFRSCLGIISLVRTYGSERVEAASRRGNDIGATTYGSIKSILQNGLDKAYANSKAPDGPPIRHANIRGGTVARPSFFSISRRINTPPFDDSVPPSNVAVIVFPPTGDSPGKNSVVSLMVSGASCWSRTMMSRQHT